MVERDIKTISFGKACRTRLGMYLSADVVEALHLGLREIYVNSFDALTETNQSRGTVTITIDSKSRRIIVMDDGPGIPNKRRDDGLWSLVAAYTLSHTGSHFDGRAVNSIGTNGVGGSIVNHTAKEFIVTSNDGKIVATAVFHGTEEGADLQSIEIDENPKKTEPRGVQVIYIPDEAVYGSAWLSEERLVSELDQMMRFYPKYKAVVKFDDHTTTISYPKGLKEANTKMYYESDNLILALNTAGDGIKPYGNRLYLPNGGKFFTHFKTQLTKMINNMSGLKLKGEQIQSVFGGYVAIFVTSPLFSNQSKTALSNTEINPEITNALGQVLEQFKATPEWAKLIKDLELELKASIAAENARAKVKGALDTIKKNSKKKLVAADKLKDCLAHGEQAWLAIGEGDSAAGALNQGRDIETVATFPIRGKFINCLKNPEDTFLNNEELQQIASILGCGLFDDYNAKNLKYGNVLIAVDADSDGLNIACLLTTFFYVCMPKFIQEGRLWWMKAPLYYDDHAEKYIFTEEQWAKEKSRKNFTRAKGLGELSPRAVELSLFGKYKNWVQLKPEHWSTFSRLIEDLMGKDVETRRQYLFDKVDFKNIEYM